MTFPFREKPSDQLRRLFQIERLERNAKNLEHASIRAGKPGIEVKGAGGATVAVVGATPDGSGLGMLHNGSVQGLKNIFADSDDVAALDGRVGTAEGRLDSHASRIGAVEGVNSTQNSRLNAVESVNSTQNSRLDAVEGEVSAARGGFPSLGARLDSHASRIGSAESVNSTQNSRLDSLESQITTVWNFLRSQFPTFPP